MVEMLGGRKVPSDFYVLVKLVSQLSSLYSTDNREALVIQSEETQNSKTVCLRISRRPRREGASLLFSPIRPRSTHHYQCDVT